MVCVQGAYRERVAVNHILPLSALEYNVLSDTYHNSQGQRKWPHVCACTHGNQTQNMTHTHIHRVSPIHSRPPSLPLSVQQCVCALMTTFIFQVLGSNILCISVGQEKGNQVLITYYSLKKVITSPYLLTEKVFSNVTSDITFVTQISSRCLQMAPYH